MWETGILARYSRNAVERALVGPGIEPVLVGNGRIPDVCECCYGLSEFR